MGRQLIAAFFIFLVLAACKHKKKTVSLSGEDPIESSDFIEFFQPLKLAAGFTDSIFLRKEKDSLQISYKIFTQFVPDSLFHKVFGKSVKPKIFALGRVQVPKAEQYLFAKIIAGDKKAVYVLAFDNKDQYMAGLPLLWPVKNSSMTQTVVMDRKFVITRNVMKKNADGSSSEGRDVYVLNEGGKNFMLIMTDALDDRPTELINPIDTLPKKNKITGDYTTGKMNLVSIRDGSKTDRVRFFIHIEKNNGECTGELRGEARLKSPNFAEYRQDGDPCTLEFRFTANAVSLKEAGCGSYRSLRCLFDGNFPKKREPKPKPARKSAK